LRTHGLLLTRRLLCRLRDLNRKGGHRQAGGCDGLEVLHQEVRSVA
jgi:hypothetical protein